jgi:putative ABC transport system permease protein
MAGRARSSRTFRWLLLLFPVDFSREFGREMERAFTASLDDAGSRKERLAVWARMVGDLAVSIPREHWDTWIGPDGGMWKMGDVLRDTGRAVRGLLKAPGFTAVVVLTLGIGIAAATTIYSVVFAVLLEPLPYPDPDRIVSVNERYEGTEQGVSISYVNAQDWKASQESLEWLALIRGGALTLTDGEGAEQVSALFVDAEYFDILGATPAIGRLFGPEDNRIPGGHAVVVLSYGAWQDRFGGDAGVIGSSINLSGAPFTVVGVLSEDHREPFPGTDGLGNDLIVPAMMAGQLDRRGTEVLEVRRWRTFGGIGKLHAGVSANAAQDDLERIAARLTEEYPGVNQGFGVLVRPFAEVNTQAVRGPVLTLLGGAIVLLLIGCFNVANLLLIRGTSRSQEMAVQLALGAGRGRLLRLLAVESLILALAGGGLGVIAASTALPLLLALAPTQLPPTADIGLSAPVLGSALAVSLAAGMLSGLLPALRVSGIDLRGPLSGGARNVGDRKGDRLRRGLVLFEVATATVLLASSALLMRSFQTLRASDSGFVTEDVLSMRVSLPAGGYLDAASMAEAATELTRRIEELPGVEWAQPWGPNRPGLTFSFQSVVPEGLLVERLSDSPIAGRHHVGPGVIADLGLTLLSGRGILESDRSDSPSVVVVSESMAEELWPGEDPLGKRVHAFVPPGQPIPPELDWTVVGVVADANHGGRVPQPGALASDNDAYFSLAQRPERAFTVLAKSFGGTDAGPIRDAIRAFDPNIPVFQVATMQENFAQEEGATRFAAQLMGSFGLLALLLASLGVYGVISFSVNQRRREIGLRAALGAQASDTLRGFLMEGLKLSGGGALLGALIAFGAIRGLQAVVPAIPDMDVAAVSIAALLLMLVAVLSSLWPAHRATRIGPVVALKGD